MLDAWVGDRGKVPAERLLPAVYDALAAPKAGAEGKVTALRWVAASVVQAGRVSKAAGDATRAAAFASLDKSTEVREAGVALFKALAEVGGCLQPCTGTIPAHASLLLSGMLPPLQFLLAFCAW